MTIARKPDSFAAMHCINRARERYGIAITQDDWSRIGTAIKHKRNAKKLCAKHRGETVWLVDYSGRQLVAIFARGRVETLLPPDARELEAYRRGQVQADRKAIANELRQKIDGLELRIQADLKRIGELEAHVALLREKQCEVAVELRSMIAPTPPKDPAHG